VEPEEGAIVATSVVHAADAMFPLDLPVSALDEADYVAPDAALEAADRFKLRSAVCNAPRGMEAGVEAEAADQGSTCRRNPGQAVGKRIDG
jgi:hypothetical protein